MWEIGRKCFEVIVHIYIEKEISSFSCLPDSLHFWDCCFFFSVKLLDSAIKAVFYLVLGSVAQGFFNFFPRIFVVSKLVQQLDQSELLFNSPVFPGNSWAKIIQIMLFNLFGCPLYIMKKLPLNFEQFSLKLRASNPSFWTIDRIMAF